nr:hypothetical protein [uncultured Roseobacter sp.]
MKVSWSECSCWNDRRGGVANGQSLRLTTLPLGRIATVHAHHGAHRFKSSFHCASSISLKLFRWFPRRRDTTKHLSGGVSQLLNVIIFPTTPLCIDGAENPLKAALLTINWCACKGTNAMARQNVLSADQRMGVDVVNEKHFLQNSNVIGQVPRLKHLRLIMVAVLSKVRGRHITRLAVLPENVGCQRLHGGSDTERILPIQGGKFCHSPAPTEKRFFASTLFKHSRNLENQNN